MANANTKIEWCDATWSPVTGCQKVSQGCKHCYAENIANRFWGDRKFTDVRCHPERLDQPLHWRKPRCVFVNSMSDLFHPDVPFEFVDQVFAVMALTPQHTYQVLTKRPERMAEYLLSPTCHQYVISSMNMLSHEIEVTWSKAQLLTAYATKSNEEWERVERTWPLPNVWLGVSVEDQTAVDERIPLLLQVPAAARFLSCEPLLAGLDLSRYLPLPPGHDPRSGHWCARCASWKGAVDWVIVGGESGPRARPMHPEWVRGLRDQCHAAWVPFFFKQWGEWVTEDQSPEDITLPGTATCWFMEMDEGGHTHGDHTPFYKVGKKAAGALLDGQRWTQYPVYGEAGE